MTIRKRRRDRTRSRIANQKRLDAIAYEKIGKSFMASMETWGGTVCPQCHKSVPARAFLLGGDIQWLDDCDATIRPASSCIITVGTSVASQYCHRDINRCASESAKEDACKWKESLIYHEMNNA